MNVLTYVSFLVFGLAAGLGHFSAIAREADDLVGGNPALRPTMLRPGRLAVTTALLVIASLNGWPMLLAAFIGFMTGRQIVLIRKRDAR